jgi:predicted MFS family arabinose efflux permease
MTANALVWRGLAALRPRLPEDRLARALAAASLIDWIGTGIWLTVSTLFFVRVVGLSPAAIGAGLGIAGVVGMLAVMPVAALTRRRQAGRVAVAMQICRGLAFLGYLEVRSAVTFAAAAALVAVFDRPTITVNQILVARVVRHEERNAAMATMHVAANVGVAAGTALGTLALLRADRGSFDAVVIADAATFFLAAWIVGRAVRQSDEIVPEEPPPSAGGVVRTLVRDRRFAAVTLGSGLLALHIPMLNVAIPLWLADDTSVPLAVMGGLLLTNTALIVLLQVRLARSVQTVRHGMRAAAVAAAAIAACCGALALAAFVSVVAAAALLVLAVAVLTFAEISQNAAAWALSFGLSPTDRRQSAYLGLFGTAQTAVVLLGPALLAFLISLQGAAAFATIAGLAALGAVAVRLGTGRG